MCLFSTTENLRMLSTSQIIIGDGTFSCVPSIFAQMYTLHAYVGSKSIPLVYALLSSKTQNDYTRMLTQIDIRCTQDDIHLNPSG